MSRKRYPDHTSPSGRYRVSTWWDRQSRNWITQIKNLAGDEVLPAEYDGNRDSVDVSRAALIREADTRDAERIPPEHDRP